ncbi:DUF5947 family protein [Conexibacter woesei]|uniref:Uncharacterized protein n=1 Tax=Conexibacter woesei (strain DSM 14684 / CCUG 47730 / CIP 108061 / JCM 11494 / NBRC 100937 / ID131577) TaxID=469383 RepID=D3F8K1_CONWI|nr:DUF5947 family protein [Conexibacter woesei]ADB50965.1 hypothetical protein Cwoe_2543 [Conexibacter woesei DSM 14684]
MRLPATGLRRMAAWAGEPGAAAPRPDAAAAPDAAHSRAAAASAEPPAATSAHGTCELCPTSLGADHRHLLQLDERRIVCVCETCWALHSGDTEFRPTGGRTLWLEDFALDDELWAAFQIPIGLAFMLRSGAHDAAGRVVALYPSPAGATECELDLHAWGRLCAANPVLDRLEPDAEALIVNRIADPPQHVIAPIDECYRLVGTIKQRWRGISGGSGVEEAIAEFFASLREGAVAA